MDEPPLPVESAFEENGVQVRIPPGELTRGGVGDDGGALDLSAGCFVVESLDHAIDELADLPVEPSVVAKENAEQLGKREDHLPVRKQAQQRLIHVLAEQEPAFLGARGAEAVRLPALWAKLFAAEGSDVVGFAVGIGALDPRDAL